MARPKLQPQFAHSPVLRYGLAATSSAIALGLALLAELYGFRNMEVPFFLFAIAATVWHAGVGPAILAVVLSSLAFDYFFTEPRYSFYVTSSELPYYAIFVLFALLLTWFAAVRRRVEAELLQARDELEIGRKRVEEALRQNETYLAEAQRLSHTGSFGWKPLTGQLIWSEETFRIFQYDRATTPTAELILRRVHPEDAAMAQKIIDWATEGRANLDFEHRLLLPDNSVKYLHVVARALEPSPGKLEYVGAVTDVTAAKQAEEALRGAENYLAESQRLTKTGSWAYDPAAEKCIYWSDEMLRIFGLDPETSKLPDREEFLRLVHPEDRETFNERIEKSRREKAGFAQDYRVVLTDGSVKHIQGIGHAVFDETGNVIRYVGTDVDVTERKRAEEEREKLRQMQADLARLSRVTTMGELTASLAHEVNQPIAAAATDANTCLRWLARDLPDLEEARAAASRVVKDAARAAEIMSRIRSLFKKEMSQRELVDVNDIIRGMIELLRSEATRYSISMRTELSDDLPLVMGDRVQLQQVTMNLIINSIDAMKDVKGTREIAIMSQRAENEQLQVSVSDTGIGIPPERADQIFDAFFTTKPHGTGMGLRISRSIIESHGGRLWATHNSPRGARFAFTLPTKT